MRYFRCLLRVCLFVFISFAVVAASGCKSKVTKSNFEKIEDGMTLSEVEKILGSGTQQGDGSGVAAQFGVNVPAARGAANTERFAWESDTATITVIFVDGKVKSKSAKGL